VKSVSVSFQSELSFSDRVAYVDGIVLTYLNTSAELN
jgi:hypothetical protein